jgi:hypothetical protein
MESMNIRKRDRSNEKQGGINPLKLTKRWIKSKPPESPDPKLYNKTCFYCKSTFFGETQAIANEREIAHNCPK